MIIRFRLDHVLCISTDEIPIPKKKGVEINVVKPKTKVTLRNTQPVYIDPDMVGYVENDELRFED